MKYYYRSLIEYSKTRSGERAIEMNDITIPRSHRNHMKLSKESNSL